MEPMEPTKQAQWRRRSEIPLMVAAVVYLAAYSVQVLGGVLMPYFWKTSVR